MDETTQTHEPVFITGKRNNVVMLAEETLYLNSIPNMASSIQESMNAMMKSLVKILNSRV